MDTDVVGGLFTFVVVFHAFLDLAHGDVEDVVLRVVCQALFFSELNGGIVVRGIFARFEEGCFFGFVWVEAQTFGFAVFVDFSESGFAGTFIIRLGDVKHIGQLRLALHHRFDLAVFGVSQGDPAELELSAVFVRDLKKFGGIERPFPFRSKLCNLFVRYKLVKAFESTIIRHIDGFAIGHHFGQFRGISPGDVVLGGLGGTISLRSHFDNMSIVVEREVLSVVSIVFVDLVIVQVFGHPIDIRAEVIELSGGVVTVAIKSTLSIERGVFVGITAVERIIFFTAEVGAICRTGASTVDDRSAHGREIDRMGIDGFDGTVINGEFGIVQFTRALFHVGYEVGFALHIDQ